MKNIFDKFKKAIVKKRTIKLPTITMPKFRLPKIKVPRLRIPIPQIYIPFKKIAVIARNIISTLVIVTGSVGLLVSYINPLPFINQYYITTPLVNNNVALLYANIEIALGVSSGLILFGLLLHVNNFKQWWRNIKATPRAILNAPMAFYNKLKKFSTKINYFMIKRGKSKILTLDPPLPP